MLLMGESECSVTFSFSWLEGVQFLWFVLGMDLGGFLRSGVDGLTWF
jgi:hypothetical protein